MVNEVQTIATEIAIRSEQIKEMIVTLIDRHEDLQDDILTLQKRKRDGALFDQQQLDDLKDTRNEAGRMVGILAIDQTELLDDLPVIRTATGKIKIATTDLANSADLIENAKARVEKVTMSLQKAEKLVVKTIGLIAQV